MASGGPPPAFGFRPPPPNGGGQFRPPPPIGQAPSYDSEGEDDGGALTSTINLVTSAANMFFKPPPPPQNDNGPPPLQQGVPPKQPPAPIETTTSMLDTPATAFQAPPPPATMRTPQGSSTPQKMTIGGNPQLTIPTIPSLPSQPATPTQFPPPRPTAESIFGFTPPTTPQAARTTTTTPTAPPVAPSSPHNVFQAPPPRNNNNATAAGTFQAPPPASPGNNNSAQPIRAAVNAVSVANNFMKLGQKVHPASPGRGFQPPSSPAPAKSPLRATVNAVAAANNFMKLGAKEQPASPVGGFQPPSSPAPRNNNNATAASTFQAPPPAAAAVGQPPASPGNNNNTQPLRAAVNAVSAANNFMKLGQKVHPASPGGFQPPSSPAPAKSPLRATVNAVAVANKFMKMGKEKQPSPKPSSPSSKLRGVVTAAAVANNFMKLTAKEPEGSGENASNPLAGEPLQNNNETTPSQVVTTGMATANSMGTLSPTRRRMPKFTPPPSPKVPVISTKSPMTPLIANTSPTAAAATTTTATSTTATSSGQRTPIRKLNLPTPSPRTRTSPIPHRQLRLPPPKSSSRSAVSTITRRSGDDNTGSTKTTTTPRSKFRLPPSRKKKTTTTTAAEPMVNLKPKVEEAPPIMEESLPPATDTTAPTTTTTTTTSETTMEKPVETPPAEPQPTAAPTEAGTEETKEPAVSEPEPKPVVEDALPEGWTETTDPISGKVYYYNADTQETSWEKPKAEEAPASAEEETSTEPAAAETESPKKAKDAFLPLGWTETTDPTSGKVYYYNADTQETSWEMPKVEAAPTTDNTIEVLSHLKSTSTGETAISAAASLEEEPKEGEQAAATAAAEEWSEVTDPNSGKVYYYNLVTQETSWDRPAAMDQPTAKESEPKAEEKQDAKDTSAEESIENTFAELNAEFGYVDPSETNEEEDATPAEQDVSEEEDYTPAEQDVPEEKDALPDGWTEAVDPTSGNKYYYNPITQETSWELPVSENAEKKEVAKVDDAAPSTDTTMEVLSAMSQLPEETTMATEEQPTEKANDLPGDWEEVVDPNSGDVYYFNSVTNETSWERPGAEASNEDNADEDPVESKELDTEETSGPAEEEMPAETSDLPADWEEVVDPKSGDVYYFNSVTNETSWERPGAEAANEDTGKEPTMSEEIQEEESSPAVEETQEEASQLPADWEEVVDPNSGDVYYFNSVTNETSWERPNVEAATEDSANEDPVESKELDAEETPTGPAVEEIPEENIDLPADWEEVVDPNNGDVYYFNSVTNETSWERPGTEAAKEGNPEVDSAAPEEVQEEESSPAVEESPEKSSDLPADWEEVVDPNSGDVYYFNSVTNETSWERPGAEVANEDTGKEAATSEEIQAEESSPAVEETQEEASQLPADWEEVVDPNSGDVYYFNSVTNETSWERPNVEAATEDSADEDPAELKELDAEETSTGPSVEEIPEENIDLPADWEEIVDPNNGDVYYFNSVTNETSWERPGTEAVKEGNPEVDSAAPEEVQEEESSPAVEESPEKSSDLPADWEEVVDPNSGDVYYFNSVTNETSWERPGAEVANEDTGKEPASLEDIQTEESSPALEETQDEANDLPADWEEVVDPNSGDVYYFNSLTNETSWERPSAEPTSEDSPEMEPAASEDVQPKETFESAAEEPPEDAAADAESSDLPENWTEVVDESTGQTYFYNSLTEETSWERPTMEEVVVEEQEDVREDVAQEENIDSGDNTGEESESLKGSELPADWIEAVDETTGQTYYYNTVSQETSWEKPAVVANEPDGVAEKHIETDECQEDAVVDDATPKTDESLPPNWIETEDESGQLYYYNTATNETSWDRPSIQNNEGGGADNGEQEVVEPVADAATDDDSDNILRENPAEGQENLPADWIEEVDETSGQTYYYNTATQETSWEKPSVVADNHQEDFDKTDEVKDHAPENDKKEIVEDDSAPDTEDELPRDWIEAVDESSRQTYYYNTVTQKTSWEKPSNASSEKESAAVEQKDEAAAVSDADDDIDAGHGTEEAHDKELPGDWVKMVDEQSGQEYYFNPETQETSWEKPSIDSAELVEPEEKEVGIGSRKVEEATEDTDVGDEDDWTEAVDESTGQTYYYNSRTEETTWEKPLVLQKEDNGIEEHSNGENDASEDPTAVPDDQNPGDEWTEVVDDATGQTYYYNTVTQETSWEKPSSLMQNSKNEAFETDGVDVDNDEGDSQVGGHDGNSLSGDEAAAASEPANEATESTDVTDQGADEDGPSPVLPECWTSAVDETTGKTYYFNSLTQETTWELPQGSEEPEGDEEPSEEGDVAEPVPADTPGEKEDESLPENWSKEVDETTSEIYYYNSITHESSWEKPGAETDNDVQGSGHEETEHSEHEETDNPEETEHSDHETDSQQSNDVDDQEREDQQDLHDETPHGDWTEAVDEGSGQTYYYNTVTGETSWEKPLELLQADDEDDEDHANDVADNDIDDAAPTNSNDENGLEESPSLPANWIEAVDETSGQTYYYNTDTQETSWERPVSTVQEDIDGIASESEPPTAGLKDDAHDENSNDPSPAENESETKLEEDAGLASDWEEVVDEASGEVYYYNSKTQETSWEKPSALLENATADAGENEIIPSVDSATEEASVNDDEPEGEGTHAVESSDLPEDWIEATDETSGQMYYYNTVTQETSWEKPSGVLKEDAPDVSETIDEMVDNNAETNDVAAEEEVDAEGEGDDSKTEKEDLPSEWIEAVDETSGQTYYYNTVTKETSWEKPSEMVAQNEEVVHENDEHDGTDDLVDHSDPAEENPETDIGMLPNDWIEAVDESTGQTYYYNTVTAETSWEKPSPDISVEDEVDVNGEIQDAVVDKNGESTDANTDESVAITDEAEAIEPEEELPSEWVETVDESTGQVYYFNTINQETSWEKPSPSTDKSEAVASDEQEPEVDEMIGEDGDEATEPEPVEENENHKDDALPSEWIEAVDETSGQTYYYNTVTQETSWEKPKSTGDETAVEEDNSEVADKEPVSEDNIGDGTIDVDGTDVAIGNSLDVSQGSLPSGWVEVVDEDSGNVYYYNSETNETSWEKPGMKSSEPTSDTLNELDQDDEAEENGDEATEPEPVEESENHKDDALPSEWIEAVDETSGQTYYYNTVTQETCWEKPKSTGDETAVEEDDNSEVADKEPVSEDRIGDAAIDVDDTDVAIGNSLDVSQDSLPSGWVEVVDEDSGNVYYYNSETSETSWEKPGMKSSEPTSDTLNELDQGDEAEEVANEEWEIVDEPKDDAVLVDEVKNTDVDLSTHVANICDERQEFGILGPLSLSEDEAVLSYVKSKFENTRSPLWGLIDIAARSRGRLRSEDGVADRNSPESSIVELLLREENGSSTPITPSKQLPSTTPAEEVDDDLRMERVQSLLLRGNRVEAVKEAVECKDFATALLVASMCDPETYKYAAKAYAENVFAGGSPMYTIGMLFSGSIQVPTTSSPGSFWGIGANELNGTWKKHLAAVISNRTAGWDRVVLSLGDRLREIGSIEGAHFCYMVCGCRFTDPLDTTTRVALLGRDHTDTSIISLTTNAALDSFDRTEAYEWAKRRGNKNATIKSFQPFKVIFATSLVDFGFEEQATLFALGIRHCTDVASAKAIDLAGEQWSRVFEDPEAMAGAFRALEERLDLAPDEDEGDAEYEKVEFEGPPAIEDDEPVGMNSTDSYEEENLDPINSTVNLTDNDATFVTAASNLMDKPGFSMTPQRDSPQAPTAEGGNLSTKPTNSDIMGPPEVARMSAIAPPVAPTTEEVLKIDTQAMPPGMPPTPTMRNSAGDKEEATPQMPVGAPAAAPVVAMTPKETIKQPERAPSTAPSVMMGKKNEPKSNRKAAPSSSEKPRSGGLLRSFRSWVIKKTNNEDVVECTLPENEEKAYYDKDLKRWVFPGDDLDELAKPMAPPPIMPSGGDSKPAAEPEPKPDINDPLAAMMAPPSRRPAALRRPGGGTPTMPPVGGAMPPMPGMPPMMPGMASPAAGGAAAPPQFAVFTPSKKQEEQKKEEE